MKTILFAMILAPALLTMSAFAHAKPSPLDPPAVSVSLDETVIESGPSGAMLEASYFNAPQGPFSGVRVTPCRLQVRLFDKTRLTQMCN